MKRGRFLRRDSEGALVEADPPSGTAASTPNPTARVQRAVGNQALQKAIAGTKKGGGERARYERDADETARQALAGPGAAAIPQGGPGLLRDDPASREVEAALGAGRPLPEGARALFEGHLGRDLSDVRLHAGPEAGALAREAGARAFTAGRHVVFAEGELPAHPEGSPLLAHELAHVAQQAGDASAPAVQCQPAPQPQGPNFDQLVVDLAQWVLNPTAATNPADVQGALAELANFGVALRNVQFSRLANTAWVVGGLHIGAESRWPQGGQPGIAVSDDLLREFNDFKTNGTTAAAFSVIRTLAHELRHLQRQRQRDLRTRPATTAERRFETEVTRLAAATPARLTPQEYAEVYSGRLLYAQTSYPVEEILARLGEVETARREWAGLQARTGGVTQADRDHMEIVLQEIGFRIYYQINILQGSAQQGTAGLTQADFNTSIQEIEREIARRYGSNSPQQRLWDLARSRLISSQYHPMVMILSRVFP